MANDLDATFKFRLPSDLLEALNQACEDNDQTAAQVLRAAVRDYVNKNAKPQGDLLKPNRSKAK
jgi:predicted transcriptional regulator